MSSGGPTVGVCGSKVENHLGREVGVSTSLVAASSALSPGPRPRLRWPLGCCCALHFHHHLIIVTAHPHLARLLIPSIHPPPSAVRRLTQHAHGPHIHQPSFASPEHTAHPPPPPVTFSASARLTVSAPGADHHHSTSTSTTPATTRYPQPASSQHTATMIVDPHYLWALGHAIVLVNSGESRPLRAGPMAAGSRCCGPSRRRRSGLGALTRMTHWSCGLEQPGDGLAAPPS